jgi:hypothetical protein
LPRVPAAPNATQSSGYDFLETERRPASGRPKGETPEEKKTRKQAVKEQRQVCIPPCWVPNANGSNLFPLQIRRVEKKVAKETFSNERSRQIKIQETKVNGMRKL